MEKRILFIIDSPFISGAELSLIEYLRESKLDVRNVYIAISKKNSLLGHQLSEYKVIELPFLWFVKTKNPIKLCNYLINIILTTITLSRAIVNYKIDIIYSNSVKSHVYGSLSKLLTGKKNIWHVRDNIKNRFLETILAKYTDKIICISDYIYQQLEVPKEKKVMIHGGIDINKWNPSTKIYQHIRKELKLPADILIVAQVGQITKWKNQIDLINCAKAILQTFSNVHFLIIGDDLSGRESKYQDYLKKEILNLGLANDVTLTGHYGDIEKIYSQVDILIHPAIDEPLGRVIIEAMAMEKPVVTYNCGGPREIVVNCETGYLVEPYNYKELAEKTIILLSNELKRVDYGRKGRALVQQKFDISEQSILIDKIICNI